MYQVRKDEPYFYRRVWRVGTEFDDVLKNVQWSMFHKLEYRPHSRSWDEKRYVVLDKNSDEFKFVMQKIIASIREQESAGNPLQGVGGSSLRQSRLYEPHEKKIVVTLPPKFEKTLIGIKKVRGGT